jgi:beta-lactamase superfamily II metal-dependent hydrolase
MPQPASPQVPESTRVRIRMYRQGIGDCFLLTFYGEGEPRHILIDCGVIYGTPRGKDTIRRVAKNIKAETGNRLEALVATHEHWDHVSGFYDAKDIFDHMDIGEIWVAWTEDPSNPVAAAMKRRNHLRLQAVHLALAQLANFGEPHLQASGRGVSELLGFFGGPVEAVGMAGFAERTSQAMDAVKKLSPRSSYWKPGEVIQRDWLPEAQVYVLAPPLEEATLKDLKARVGTETYELAGVEGTFALALEGLLAAAADEPADPSRDEHLTAALPFHPSLQWRDAEELAQNPKFASLMRSYRAEKSSWRRIDQDWLLSAARLGLQLDKATNNTSLVLAFELSDTGEVLLFAADAQIASWKSWLTIEKFDTTDLLRRTVFYKVGHHGSHNATLKDGGLEAMTSPELVAAIPVDQNFANNSKHWPMPAVELYKRLQERTRGRILRADAAWPTGTDEPPANLAEPDWQRFTGAVSLDPDGLFIDYFI